MSSLEYEYNVPYFPQNDETLEPSINPDKEQSLTSNIIKPAQRNTATLPRIYSGSRTPNLDQTQYVYLNEFPKPYDFDSLFQLRDNRLSIEKDQKDMLFEYIIRNNVSAKKLQDVIERAFQFIESEKIIFKAELQLFTDPEDPEWKVIHLIIYVSVDLDKEILQLWHNIYKSIDIDSDIFRHLVITLRPSRNG